MALGGLGTSTLEIGRNGAFQNLRLQNEWTGDAPPTPEATFMSVYARTASGKEKGCLLQLTAPEGLEGVDALTYTGRFPFVEIAYRCADLPCQVHLEAFSPFVPHDADSSSLPLVFLTLRLCNPGAEPVTATASVSWVNDIAIEKQQRSWPGSGNRNSVMAAAEPAVLMETRVEGLTGSRYLLACLPAQDVTYSAVADWWPGLDSRWMGPNVKPSGEQPWLSWRCFLDGGALPAEGCFEDGLGRFSHHRPVAAVAGQVNLAPGEEKQVRFALVWFFPYHWDRPGARTKILLGHEYAVRFPNGPRDVADWAFPKFDSLRRRSLEWRSLIEDSSLPLYCRALTTEILYLLPRITWWLADGSLIFYESIDCPRMQTTILDIYIAPVLSALFPELHARSLRATAAYQLDSGEIPSTLGISSIKHPEYRVFNTGDASVLSISIVWAMLWGGDSIFAQDMYPVLKKALQWAERELDIDRDGIPDSHGIDQGWDTFPMHGAAAYIADQWVAALLAGEKMARRFGDSDFAEWCAKARCKASETVEKVLWNGEYYDLAYDRVTGIRSGICFADQFTYGTVPARILALGDTHPHDRIRRSLEAIWRLNVKPCRFVCRMGSNADGTPADSTVHREQEGVASQSNAFTPVSVAPLAAAAIQHGMVDEGLALAEEMAKLIIEGLKAPWSGQLLFDSRTGDCFYGLHYSDCLILWDVMVALLGVHVDMLDRTLTLAPPRIPVQIPVFGCLFSGQVTFSVVADGVELRLESLAEQPSIIRTMAVRLPIGTEEGPCSVVNGGVREVRRDKAGETVLEDVIVAPRGELILRWAVLPRSSSQLP